MQFAHILEVGPSLQHAPQPENSIHDNKVTQPHSLQQTCGGPGGPGSDVKSSVASGHAQRDAA